MVAVGGRGLDFSILLLVPKPHRRFCQHLESTEMPEVEPFRGTCLPKVTIFLGVSLRGLKTLFLLVSLSFFPLQRAV